jgi:hypothetical protein
LDVDWNSSTEALTPFEKRLTIKQFPEKIKSIKKGAANGRPFQFNPISCADYLPAGGGM